MIDYHRFCQIKDLHDRQELNATQIAGVLSLDPRTVAYWLRQERFRPRKSASRTSKLDPFKPQIVQMLEKYPYSAAQVLQRLREQAFAVFGGVPHSVMVDNLKSAVLKRALGEAPVVNPKYADFAKHHGFRIVPCNVGKGNEKGRVENGVGYVKKNFLAGLDIADFSMLAPAATHWLDTVANVRLHGETRKPPV